jgi:hypothetical protein
MNVSASNCLKSNFYKSIYVLTFTKSNSVLESIQYHNIYTSVLLTQPSMESLKKATEDPLYDESKGCTRESMMLRCVLKLLMLKARYGLSDAGFDAFLSNIAGMLSKKNKVLANTYYAKKLISPLTMGVEKIHTRRNHCILYQVDDYKDLESYPKCNTSRYKTNKDYLEEKCVASVSNGNKRKKDQTKTSKFTSNEKK